MNQEDTVTRTRIEVKNRVLYLVAGFITATALIALSILVYWLITPTEALTIKEPLEVVNADNKISNGGVLNLRAEFCKNTDTPGDVEVTMIGKSQLSLLKVREGLKKGCNDLILNVQIPVVVNFEPRRIHYKVTYQLNPLRTVVKEFDSEEFTIEDNGTIRTQEP